jgi:hypothetical protein
MAEAAGSMEAVAEDFAVAVQRAGAARLADQLVDRLALCRRRLGSPVAVPSYGPAKISIVRVPEMRRLSRVVCVRPDPCRRRRMDNGMPSVGSRPRRQTEAVALRPAFLVRLCPQAGQAREQLPEALSAKAMRFVRRHRDPAFQRRYGRRREWQGLVALLPPLARA